LPQAKDVGSVVADPSVTLGSAAALKQSGYTVVCFTRDLSQTGSAGVSLANLVAGLAGRRLSATSSASSTVNVILAASSTAALSTHPHSSQYQVAATLDLVAGSLTKQQDSGKMRMIILHAALMILAWAVLLPSGERSSCAATPPHGHGQP
jgi:hypothetical protein